MKLDPVMLEALNQQINRERQNSVPYQAMANHCQLISLPGLAKFFREAASEELGHAQRLTDYITDRNDAVMLLPLQAQSVPLTTDLAQVGATFLLAALAQEEENTIRLKTLYRMARESEDFQTETALIWFIDEQTQSVAELIEMHDQWLFAAGCPAAVLALDHELKG